MRNLADFELPSENEIALCEINGRVHCMNAEYANVGAFTNSVSNLKLQIFSLFISHMKKYSF